MKCALCNGPVSDTDSLAWKFGTSVHAACSFAAQLGRETVRKAIQSLGLPDPDEEGQVAALRQRVIELERAVERKGRALADARQQAEAEKHAAVSDAVATMVASMEEESFRATGKSDAAWRAKFEAAGQAALSREADLSREVVQLRRERDEAREELRVVKLGPSPLPLSPVVEQSLRAQVSALVRDLNTARDERNHERNACADLATEVEYLKAEVVSERGKVAGLRDALAEARGERNAAEEAIGLGPKSESARDALTRHGMTVTSLGCHTCDLLHDMGRGPCSLHDTTEAAK